MPLTAAVSNQNMMEPRESERERKKERKGGRVRQAHGEADASSINPYTKVPEGHHPRGTTLREALRGYLPLKGFSGASAGVSSRVLRGLCGAMRGSAGVRGIFRE